MATNEQQADESFGEAMMMLSGGVKSDEADSDRRDNWSRAEEGHDKSAEKKNDKIDN